MRVVATGRPSLEKYFEHRAPHWIKPEHKNNKADLRVLLTMKLESRKCVAAADVGEATRILVDKSQVGRGGARGGTWGEKWGGWGEKWSGWGEKWGGWGVLGYT